MTSIFTRRLALSLITVAVAGAGGRMGRMLIDAVLASPDCVLSGALDVPGSPALGQDAGLHAGKTTGVHVTAVQEQAVTTTSSHIGAKGVDQGLARRHPIFAV